MVYHQIINLSCNIITSKYRCKSSVPWHKCLGIFSINTVLLISKLNWVNFSSEENLRMNIIDSGNRKKAKEICAHKYCESGSAVGSRFPTWDAQNQ